MEKEKLLRILVLISTWIILLPLVRASNQADISQVDIGQVEKNQAELEHIAITGRKAGLDAIDAEYQRLQNMLRSDHSSVNMSKHQDVRMSDNLTGNLTGNLAGNLVGNDQDYNLRIFVSSSMSRSLLKHYANEAKRYGAILVFRGLPEGSWVSLNMLVADMVSVDAGESAGQKIQAESQQDGPAIQIDDEAFAKYAVSSVPAIVLSKDGGWKVNVNEKEPAFDKVTGNVGIKGALELFAKEGDLSDIAARIMTSGGSL